MSKITNIKSNILKYHSWFILPLVLIYLSFNIFDGNNGLLSHKYLDEQILILEERIDLTVKEKDLYQIKIATIKNSSKNTDLVDEEVRAVLGYAQKDEFVIYLD